MGGGAPAPFSTIVLKIAIDIIRNQGVHSRPMKTNEQDKQFSEVFTVRVTNPTFKQLKELADGEKRPVGMMARVLLEEALEARIENARRARVNTSR